MSAQLRCAEIVEAGQPLSLVTRDLPSTPPRGASLKTLYAGVCHSDVHLLEDRSDFGDGRIWKYRDHIGDKFKGIVMGHEILGEITSLGAESKAEEYGLKVGDVVIVYPWIGCGRCQHCEAGFTNVCPKQIGVYGDIGWDHDLLGGFSTHVRVPDLKYAVKLPSSVPVSTACLLACSGLTTYCALQKLAESMKNAKQITGSSTLVIIGVGGLGLWAIKLARVIYPQVKVIGVDVAQEKLDLAHKSGSDVEYLWNTKAPITELVTKLKAERIDGVLDFVGSQLTTSLALMSAHKMTTVVMVGLCGGKVNFPIVPLITNAVSLRGSIVGRVDDLRELVKLVETHKLTYSEVKFHPLDDINSILDKLKGGSLKGRAIIQYSKM